MSVMGFQKKSLDGVVGGWGELYANLFWIFGIILTLQRPLRPLEESEMIWLKHSNSYRENFTKK